MADYADVYAPGSRFHRLGQEPTRILVDAEGTTVAQVFCNLDGVTRIHLCTELGGGRWVLTENNEGELDLQRPEGFHVGRVRKDASPAAIVAKHREALAAMKDAREAPVAARTFEDFVASYERRWSAIRAHRRAIGWVLPSEITFAPGTSRETKDRIHRELRRIAAED